MTDLLEIAFTLGSISAILAVVAMLLAYRYRHLQDMMVYHPNVPENSTQICADPADFGLSSYDEVRIETTDGITLHGYFLHHSPATATTHPSSGSVVVYFHGNAGNIGHRLPIARLLVQNLHCSVLMVDYRGYGLSDPVMPTEEGLKLDAQAVMDFLLRHPRVHRDKIFVFGTSLGGAVAIDLAARPQYMRHVAGLILENTFTSIGDMADTLFAPMIYRTLPRGSKLLVPFLKYVVKPVVLFVGWWSIDRIRKVAAPTLLLSGLRDELVPPSHMKSLYEVSQLSSRLSGCERDVQFVEFPQGKHNDLFLAKGYAQHIDQFMKAALKRRQVEVV